MNHALSILNWMELPDEDRPAEHIWLDAELLDDHFTSLASRREAKAQGMETVDDAPMMQNEITKSWRR